jgi:hypothetical protein
MNQAHSQTDRPHGGGGPDSLHDMNLGRIVVIGVIALVVFAAGIFWAYKLMVGRENEIRAAGPVRVPTEIGKPEIGIVDQVPFEIDHRIEDWRAAYAKRLSSYGWIDRAQGITHIPIEKAMERVVAAPPDIPGEGVPPAARPVVSPSAPRSSAKPGRAP